MLKERATSVSPMTTSLFNTTIFIGLLSDQWKTSLVIPIPKSGHPSNPANYKPISLLSTVSKLLERYVCDVLLEHLKVSPQQWGFQPRESTTDAILSAVNDWFIHMKIVFKSKWCSLTCKKPSAECHMACWS